MKTYGNTKKIISNFRDNHIHINGYVNWWEVECKNISKSSERFKSKIELKKDVYEYFLEQKNLGQSLSKRIGRI